MARNDFKIRTAIAEEFSVKWSVAAGSAASIKAGEPTKVASATGAAGTGVEICADGDPTSADGKHFAGLAKDTSTDTASAAGYCVVWLALPGLVYSGVAKTSTTFDTDAEIYALMGSRVVLDLTSTTWTVDAAATDAAANGVVIIGGDANTKTVFFQVTPAASYLTNTA